MRFGGLQPTSLSDFPGHVAAVAFARGCDFRCPYCHNPALVGGGGGGGPRGSVRGQAAGRDDAAIDQAAVLDLLRRRRGKLSGLVLTGGEPTLQRDVAPFLRRVKALGYAVKLDTNGTRPDVLGRLIDERLVDYVALDVKAPWGHYDRVAGVRRGAARRVRDSVELLLTAAVDHEFRTTVVHPLLTVDDVTRIGRELLGAARYVLQPFVAGVTLDPTLPAVATPFSPEELDLLVDRLVAMGVPCEVRGGRRAAAGDAARGVA